MSRLGNSLTICLLLIAAVTAHEAQTTKPARKPGNTAAPTATPPPAPEPPRVKEEYDKFKDTTRLSLSAPLPNRTDNSFELYVTDSSPGRTYKPTDFVAFAFLSDKGSLFGDSSGTLYLIVNDDTRMEFDAKYVSGGSRMCLISQERFHTIANAKKVEGRIGTIEFELSDDLLKALQDFSSRMKKAAGTTPE